LYISPPQNDNAFKAVQPQTDQYKLNKQLLLMSSPTKDNNLLIAVFDDVKELLSITLRISEQFINSRDTLTGDLGFTKNGLRDFADKINAFPKFAQLHVAITSTKVAGCSTVSDLASAIFDAIP
jgi:hypothetical protein